MLTVKKTKMNLIAKILSFLGSLFVNHEAEIEVSIPLDTPKKED